MKELAETILYTLVFIGMPLGIYFLFFELHMDDDMNYMLGFTLFIAWVMSLSAIAGYIS